MDKVYRTKMDWWLWLVISVGVIVILASSGALLVNPPREDVPAVWIALAMLLLAAFMVWILFSVHCMVTATELRVRAAFFRWRIPLEQMPQAKRIAFPSVTVPQRSGLVGHPSKIPCERSIATIV